MSGAVSADEEAAPRSIANYSATRKTTMINGVEQVLLEVRYGANKADPALPEHVIQIRKLDMGDQFDLMEIAGANTENTPWLMMAITAQAVVMFDNVPERRDLTRSSLRATLVKLGPLGIRAVQKAFADFAEEGAATPDQMKATAGN